MRAGCRNSLFFRYSLNFAGDYTACDPHTLFGTFLKLIGIIFFESLFFTVFLHWKKPPCGTRAGASARVMAGRYYTAFCDLHPAHVATIALAFASCTLLKANVQRAHLKAMEAPSSSASAIAPGTK